MKEILLAVMSVALTVTGLPGQTPAKTNPKASANTSNTELNLQAYILLLRKDVNKQKSRIVAEVMQFDADDAAAFWPIYKDFQTDLSKIGDQIVDLVNRYVANYDNMTNDVADQLANTLLRIEEQRTELKKEYYVKIKNALDAITATRFLQVENQIERVSDLQIASKLPVVSGKGR